MEDIKEVNKALKVWDYVPIKSSVLIIVSLRTYPACSSGFDWWRQ
jgi:hypothetical protein